jgi:hypothetical protein
VPSVHQKSGEKESTSLAICPNFHEFADLGAIHLFGEIIQLPSIMDEDSVMSDIAYLSDE